MIAEQAETMTEMARSLSALEISVDATVESAVWASENNAILSASLQEEIGIARQEISPLSRPANSSSTYPSVPEPREETPYVHAVNLTIPVVPSGSFKPSFKDKYTPGKGSIDSFLYVFGSSMEEATDCQKLKHIPSCLSRLAQEIMVPHLMISSTWEQVQSALVQEFGIDQTQSNQKQSFRVIHLKQGENPSKFADRFYCKA